MIDQPFTGRCLRADISSEVNQPPLASALYHCTYRQRQSGSLMSMVCVAHESAFHCRSELKLYRDRGDSGDEVLRYVRGDCGSPVLSKVAAQPELVFIKARTLDN